jgi:hypothetical protein
VARSKRNAIASAVFLASVAIAHEARAQGDDLARARQLFDEAGDFERRGQWAAAQDRLRQAIHIRETPNLHYALGWALENDDHLVAARAEYETAKKLAEATHGDEVAQLAAARLVEIDRATPTIEVRVPHGTTAVVIDAKASPLRDDVATSAVDPGVHVVTVSRPGRPDAVERVYVARGVSRVVEVRGDAITPTEKSRLLPWLLVGGGAALAAGGVGLFASASGDASDRDTAQSLWCSETACVGGAATRPETAQAAAYRKAAADATSRGNTKQAVGGALGAAGLVAAGVGIYLLVKPSEEERGPHLDASVGPAGASASATFHF